MNNNASVILHLSLIAGVGPATIKTICNSMPINSVLSDIYSWSIADFRTFCGLSETIARTIVVGLSSDTELVQEQERIVKSDVSCITICDDIYPQLLKTIYCPPAVLYVQGNLVQHRKTLAVVGSRQATTYAHRALQKILPSLITCDWTIVSGGALGVDTMAHTIALEQSGNTVVVLGSGLLRPYPLQNIKLFERVIDAGGAIVSAFAMTESPHPGNFPARNRIIAGLSKGCLIVQAAQKSGARITAEYALEQGRELFAVPGLIDDALSAGCHALIKQGAKLVHDAQDILEEFGEQEMMNVSDVVKIQEHKNMDFLSESTSCRDIVLRVCMQPQTFDELLDVAQQSAVTLQEILFDLQLEGTIAQDFTGRWYSR
jgi:DNA processing protein